MNKIKIALAGYGSQGSRIAEAISAQPDMKLAGVILKNPDIYARMAFRKGFAIHVINNEDADNFKKAKIDVHGLLPDILSRIDVVVDATPSGVGKKNKEIYSKYGVKAIFQAGEQFDVADIPVFIGRLQYKQAMRASFVRIPSPYTVSLFRTFYPLDLTFGIRDINCTFIMPGTEPMKGQSGPVDTVIPDRPALLQLIKDEFRQIMPKPTLMLSSFRVPSILLGTASIILQLRSKFPADDVAKVLSKASRVVIVKGDSGVSSTDTIFEYIRRTSRPSADIYEVCIWHEQIEITNATLKLVLAFDPHRVQTPEIIDAIRALVGKVGMEESFSHTNNALKILSPGMYP